MTTTIKKFGYRTRRSEYAGIAGVLSFLIVVEAGVLDFLIVRALPTEWLQLLAALLLIGLHIYIIGSLTAPLRTRHILTPSVLKVRLGWNLKLDLRRDDIIEVKTRHIKKDTVSVKPRYEADQQLLDASFSDYGQILLSLSQTYRVRVGFKHFDVKEVVINTDQPQELITLLNPIPAITSLAS